MHIDLALLHQDGAADVLASFGHVQYHRLFAGEILGDLHRNLAHTAFVQTRCAAAAFSMAGPLESMDVTCPAPPDSAATVNPPV
jgi:hypothetical protein